MSVTKLILGLKYIREVREELPEELNKMTVILNDIRDNLNDVIEKNNNQQEKIIEQLIEVQKKLHIFPETIATQKGLLQQKMNTVGGKIKKLNETMINQQKELNLPIQALNNYFEKFEQQLEVMKTNHLKILREGISTFNQLWETLKNNHDEIEITWQSTQQEIEILADKINYFQEIIDNKSIDFTDNINDSQEDINEHIENNLKENIYSYSENLQEVLENAIDNIKEKIDFFREDSSQNIENSRNLFKGKVADFVEEISKSIDLDRALNELEESNNLLKDNGEEIEVFIEKLKQLIEDIEQAGESLGVG